MARARDDLSFRRAAPAPLRASQTGVSLVCLCGYVGPPRLEVARRGPRPCAQYLLRARLAMGRASQAPSAAAPYVEAPVRNRYRLYGGDSPRASRRVRA